MPTVQELEKKRQIEDKLAILTEAFKLKFGKEPHPMEVYGAITTKLQAQVDRFLSNKLEFDEKDLEYAKGLLVKEISSDATKVKGSQASDEVGKGYEVPAPRKRGKKPQTDAL